MNAPIQPVRRSFQCASPNPLRLSFALALVALAAGCSSGGDDLGDPLPTSSSPDSDSTTSLFTSLGKSFLEGGANQVGSTLTGWALGQLGIAGTDSTGQALMEIESTLQDIDAQLKEIAAELGELITEEVVSNCQQLSSALTSDLGRINTALEKYNDIICTGNGSCANMAPPSNVPEATLMDFMDFVLDTPNGGTNSMDVILDRIQAALVGATQGGIIRACTDPNIPGLALPADGSFNDADYYTRIQPVSAYYYYYQTVATLLYCEAQRYLAYVTAGAPDSDTLDPDEMKDFLLSSTDPQVIFIMNETADRMQTTWNNLRNQFNLVGAPYTNEDLLLHVHYSAPVLFVLDMVAFTAAAGESCSDMTTDNYECTSVLRGPYTLSSEPIKDVEYSGQKGHWSFANASDLSTIMTGWNDNEAWKYLALNNGTTTRGFKNINNIVLIANETLTGTFSTVYAFGVPYQVSFDYVSFIDTNLHFQTPGLNGILPVSNSTAIAGQIQVQSDEVTIVGANRTTHDFLVCQGKITPINQSEQTATIDWTAGPGWAPSTTTQRADAFHLPVIHVDGITPHEGLQAKNAAGMFTMCTGDFELWFAAVVPPPQFN